jgi:hypothetical protein
MTLEYSFLHFRSLETGRKVLLGENQKIHKIFPCLFSLMKHLQCNHLSFSLRNTLQYTADFDVLLKK